MKTAAARSAFPESEAEERLCPFGKDFDPPISHCVGPKCAAWEWRARGERTLGPRKGEVIQLGRCAR